ncbi:hypothetical protein SAMN05444365_102689 [Micromonospora pattaloongensis]|uniref:Uncharacterized protein n=1 Tax=Micromonospora pattaloongensis TaxID=405436 RepID=A0A1H3KZQ2_9ACTN|nr:hypothetical protein [Micromonospora pattaloongensis]SDY57124.1 hypothetical protein SAMN05444365_102689 [Micromonospora pattaloongensis]
MSEPREAAPAGSYRRDRPVVRPRRRRFARLGAALARFRTLAVVIVLALAAIVFLWCAGVAAFRLVDR